MEIIHKFGTVKKKHTYLYNNFDDTMKEEFRKLKGRFYKKTNHWVFPFVKEENVKLNDNSPTQESVSDEIVQVSEENQEIVSVGIQTDEENSIVSTKPISEVDANADESTVETKSSGVSESYDSDHVIMDNFSDHLSSVIETSCSSCDVESLEMTKNMEDNKIQYKFKPPTIFYHHVGDYF
jgi:hypothetical protein